MALAIDNRQRGIWVKSAKHHRAFYIPFSMINLVNLRNQQLLIYYRQAFIIDANGNPHLLGGGQLTYSCWLLNEKQLQEFIVKFNELVSKRQQIKVAGESPKKLRLRQWGVLSLVLVVLSVVCVSWYTPAKNPLILLKIRLITIQSEKH